MDFITDFDEERDIDPNESNMQIKPSSNGNNSNLLTTINFITQNQREESAYQAQIKTKAQEEKRIQELQRKKRLFIHPKNTQKVIKPSIIKEKDGHTDKDELKDIKNYYLGKKRERKKIFRPKENSKDFFVFEWHESEDTSKNVHSLYSMQNKTSVLFGRGNIGGIDPKEIQKQSKQYEDLIHSYNNKATKRKRERSHSRSISKSKDKDVTDSNSIQKTITWSNKSILDMTERDYRIFREDNDIIIKGGKRAPKPMRQWSESNLPQFLVKRLNEESISKPTPVQMQCIPLAIDHHDFIGLAPTGSGKTLAFLLPLIAYLKTLPSIKIESGPYALILTPTRELAIQINEQFIKYSKETKLKSACIIGGKNSEEQSIELVTGVEVIIATPGRLKEALERQFTVLIQCKCVIIDEADKMISENFEETLKSILDNLPSTQEHTTMMFSATMNNSIEKLARKYLKNAFYVSIGEPGSGKKDIEQRVEMISENEKKERVRDIIDKYRKMIIVFLNKKHKVDSFVKYLDKNRINAAGMHGGKSQDNREKSLNGFKSGKYDVLVCTSVLARGIDVEGVKAVINYDCPMTIEDYNHRIGRTGRAGMKGIAYTFLTENDEEMFYDIREYLEKNDQRVPEDLKEHPASLVRNNKSKEVNNEEMK